MLAICCLSLFLVGLDVTAVNVALPAIGRDLSASVSGLQWTVDAYTVVMASLLMLGGSTGDRLGRRRTFATGLTVFSVGSVLCSLAPTTSALIAARVLQAVGASMLNPVAMSIITNTFTEPRERAQAIGVWAAVFGLSMAAGPVLGGLLTDALDWRAIFWLNLPVGAAALFLTLRYVPESKAERARRPDPVGQVLVIALLAGLTYGIVEAPGHGWGSAEVVGAFVLAAVALVGVLAYEPRRTDPLLDLRFFRSIPLASAVGLAIAAFAAFGGFLFLNTLYLQQSRGLSALDAGLATAPMALAIALLAPIAGRLVGARGPRIPLLIAGVAGLAGTALMLGVEATTPLPRVLLAYVVFGVGFAFVNAPVTNTAVSGMPREQAGVAAAVATTSRQVGLALGVAIAGAIFSTQLSGSSPAQLAAATHAAWWPILAAEALVLVLAFVATSARAVASAQRTARELNPEALAPVAA
ncbi:MAG: DHA2 family efflux MFS transporter permease subunit [Solirubrobacteraceae bacterium]|nr:DHA2 family efflux MFS transporter permease subunit [Solirubrobacteraceae bacterium]